MFTYGAGFLDDRRKKKIKTRRVRFTTTCAIFFIIIIFVFFFPRFRAKRKNVSVYYLLYGAVFLLRPRTAFLPGSRLLSECRRFFPIAFWIPSFLAKIRETAGIRYWDSFAVIRRWKQSQWPEWFVRFNSCWAFSGRGRSFKTFFAKKLFVGILRCFFFYLSLPLELIV